MSLVLISNVSLDWKCQIQDSANIPHLISVSCFSPVAEVLSVLHIILYSPWLWKSNLNWCNMSIRRMLKNFRNYNCEQDRLEHIKYTKCFCQQVELLTECLCNEKAILSPKHIQNHLIWEQNHTRAPLETDCLWTVHSRNCPKSTERMFISKTT